MARLSDEELILRAACANDLETLATLTGLLPNGGPMPTLNDEMKTFIVKRLACYETPSRVAEAVKANFDIEISRQHVYAYDPDSSPVIGQRWKDLHSETRRVWLHEVAEIGIAQKSVRLAMLDRMARNMMANNRIDRTLACLEQAAKECGGMYENRRPVVLQLQQNSADPIIESTPFQQLPELQPPNANRQ
jgi:hypothetical protein